MQIRLRHDTIQFEILKLFPFQHLIASTSVHLCALISLFEVAFHVPVASLRYLGHCRAMNDNKRQTQPRISFIRRIPQSLQFTIRIKIFI